jgi:hypothetical protein
LAAVRPPDAFAVFFGAVFVLAALFPAGFFSAFFLAAFFLAAPVAGFFPARFFVGVRFPARVAECRFWGGLRAPEVLRTAALRAFFFEEGRWDFLEVSFFRADEALATLIS